MSERGTWTVKHYRLAAVDYRGFPMRNRSQLNFHFVIRRPLTASRLWLALGCWRIEVVYAWRLKATGPISPKTTESSLS